MKRINKIRIALLLVALIAALPAVGFIAAAEETPTIVDSGYCGANNVSDDVFYAQTYDTNASWTLDDKGWLTISGEGRVYGRVSAMGDTPWCTYSYGGGYNGHSIKYLKIESGITNVPAAVCLCNSALLYAEIPDTVTEIGEFAFYGCEKLSYITIPKSVTIIENSAFNNAEGRDGTLKDVYFTGSEEEWNDIDIGRYNDELLLANIHFNSEGPRLDKNSGNDDGGSGFFRTIRKAIRGFIALLQKILRFFR